MLPRLIRYKYSWPLASTQLLKPPALVSYHVGMIETGLNRYIHPRNLRTTNDASDPRPSASHQGLQPPPGRAALLQVKAVEICMLKAMGSVIALLLVVLGALLSPYFTGGP